MRSRRSSRTNCRRPATSRRSPATSRRRRSNSTRRLVSTQSYRAAEADESTKGWTENAFVNAVVHGQNHRHLSTEDLATLFGDDKLNGMFEEVVSAVGHEASAGGRKSRNNGGWPKALASYMLSEYSITVPHIVASTPAAYFGKKIQDNMSHVHFHTLAVQHWLHNWFEATDYTVYIPVFDTEKFWELYNAEMCSYQDVPECTDYRSKMIRSGKNAPASTWIEQTPEAREEFARIPFQFSRRKNNPLRL